ncbi:MAG: hypothetical protein GY944_18180, partial [bacterium]|nr:hypothetical protein [bacterium]
MNLPATTLLSLATCAALVLPVGAPAEESAGSTVPVVIAEQAPPLPAIVWTPTQTGQRWTYAYVRERSRALEGTQPEVEKLRGTRVDEVASKAVEYGEDVVRVHSVLRAKSAQSPNEITEEHTGFYRTADTSFELVAEKNPDPTSAVEVLVRYDVPLTLLESSAQPGQRWKVGVRSQGDVHTDLEGEVLGVQDVETPAGLFEQCLV